MPITELLEENARKYGNDVALVEVNPQVQETRRVLWKDYDLIQPTSSFWYRREITWHVFDEKANRFAQLLMSRGVKKGDKVGELRLYIGKRLLKTCDICAAEDICKKDFKNVLSEMLKNLFCF